MIFVLKLWNKWLIWSGIDGRNRRNAELSPRNRDKMNELDRINRWIAQGSFIQAYYAVLTGLETSPDCRDLLELSKELSATLRSRCFDLASSKATEMSEALHELEALLYLVIRLNGEGIYQ